MKPDSSAMDGRRCTCGAAAPFGIGHERWCDVLACAPPDGYDISAAVQELEGAAAGTFAGLDAKAWHEEYLRFIERTGIAITMLRSRVAQLEAERVQLVAQLASASPAPSSEEDRCPFCGCGAHRDQVLALHTRVLQLEAQLARSSHDQT